VRNEGRGEGGFQEKWGGIFSNTVEGVLKWGGSLKERIAEIAMVEPRGGGQRLGGRKRSKEKGT